MDDDLTGRLRRRLTGARTGPGPQTPPERGREGYTLWQRYLAALLHVRLPVRRPRDRA